MTQVIALFNHKGGVSKSTTTFHLGWKMASLGKKVLLVDADPQCNLTGLTLGTEDYAALQAFYDSKQNTDIFNSLAPLFAIDSAMAQPWAGAIWEREDKKGKKHGAKINIEEADSVYTRLSAAVLEMLAC